MSSYAVRLPERVMRQVEALASFRPGVEDITPDEAMVMEMGFVPPSNPLFRLQPLVRKVKKEEEEKDVAAS